MKIRCHSNCNDKIHKEWNNNNNNIHIIISLLMIKMNIIKNDFKK